MASLGINRSRRLERFILWSLMEKLSLKVYVEGVVVLTDEFCPSLPMSLGSEPFPNSKLPQFSVFKGLQTLWVNVLFFAWQEQDSMSNIYNLNNCTTFTPLCTLIIGLHIVVPYHQVLQSMLESIRLPRAQTACAPRWKYVTMTTGNQTSKLVKWLSWRGMKCLRYQLFSLDYPFMWVFIIGIF